MRWAHVLEQLQQHPDEAVYRLGRQPARGIHRRQRMKRAEDVPGAIDQNQLLAFSGHQSKLSDTVRKTKASRGMVVPSLVRAACCKRVIGVHRPCVVLALSEI